MHCFWPILRKDYECLEQLPLRRRDWPDLEPVDNLITSGSYYFEVGKPVILLWNWEASHTTLKLGDRGATLKSEIAKLINFMTKLFGNLSSFSWNLMSKFVFLIPEWFTKQEEADARKNFTQVSSFHEWDVRSVIPTGLCFKNICVNMSLLSKINLCFWSIYPPSKSHWSKTPEVVWAFILAMEYIVSRYDT